MKQPNEIAMVHLAPSADVEYQAWVQGAVVETISFDPTHAVHVVRPSAYKPEGEDWRPYDGVALIVARETYGRYEMEFLNKWPEKREANA